MAQVTRNRSIRAIANQRVNEDMWGAPESPEFSAVQRLMYEFQSHENAEERWLSIYKKIADGSEDPLIRFLLGLIIADEERHRELMGRMVSRLKDDLAWTRSEGTTPKSPKTERDIGKLLPALKHFVELERTGIKDYQKLSKESRKFHHGLFPLLCQAMIHDSRKHIGILEFLVLRLRDKSKLSQSAKRG